MKKYHIRINTGDERDSIENVLNKLFAVGFVFTENRYKTFAEILRHYTAFNDWRYITVGVSSNECKAILHASVRLYHESILITMNNFLKLAESGEIWQGLTE